MKKIAYNTFIVLLILAGIAYVCSRFIHIGGAYTDDAQVRQLMMPVNSRVQGFISDLRFDEFQAVHRGDTLAIIEDTQYRLALAQAEAALSNAEAGRVVTTGSVSTAQAGIDADAAAVAEVKVQMENASRELERYRRLLAKGAVTQQQYDNVETTYRSLQARLEQMQSVKHTSSLRHAEQSMRLGQSDASIELARVGVEQAALNLSYTVILAPCDGHTGRKEVMEGQLIQPGQTVVNIISDDDLWVVANYRERQLADIAEGDAVMIEVDAIPHVTFRGHVQRISGGTEASYSPLPLSNSAGNFVKVEQRVPVRIAFDKDNDADAMRQLRNGLNAECKVRH